ncbi:MAG: ABC transporter permease [Clostridia bacterium]|nr:ABC transporter permease [Clostridia bacterium]
MNAIIIFIQKAIGQGIGILFGANGEILTEKSGNLNLGVPGMMYMGGIAGLSAAFLYENAAANPLPVVGFMLSILASVLAGALGGLIYSFLTTSLRANQNVTGLALTTFGVGVGNFFGGSLSKLSGGIGQISVATTASAFREKIPLLKDIPVIGDVLFSYGFLTYFSIALSIYLAWYINRTRRGLNLRAVGEMPATADAAGINVTSFKYLATCIGGAICGLGGLYFVMEYSGGTWTNNGFGDRGWLAIALVIFARWNPLHAIWGSILFGALYILYLYIPGLGRSMQEIFKMLPYIVTIVVLVLTSLRKKKEDQPPESLGLAYFREER